MGLREEDVEGEEEEEEVKSSEIRFTEGEALSSRVVCQRNDNTMPKNNIVNL